jgi:hypothetical protein
MSQVRVLPRPFHSVAYLMRSDTTRHRRTTAELQPSGFRGSEPEFEPEGRYNRALDDPPRGSALTIRRSLVAADDRQGAAVDR